MTRPNPPSTPLSKSKSAALSRVLDLVPRGYAKYTSGEIPERKLMAFLRKFHERYGIGCSQAQRITRKKYGLANAALVLFLPSCNTESSTVFGTQTGTNVDTKVGTGSDTNIVLHTDAGELTKSGTLPGQTADLTERRVSWLLLVTPGGGRVTEEESLKDVAKKPHLVWLGYELVRYANCGKSSWTWRRPKEEMAAWYAQLGSQLGSRRAAAAAQTLQLISRQPGFSGVGKQSRELIQFARSKGYQGEVPFLFNMHKVPHGLQVKII